VHQSDNYAAGFSRLLHETRDRILIEISQPVRDKHLSLYFAQRSERDREMMHKLAPTGAAVPFRYI